MFSPDQDYSNYPYQLLIRARTQAEFARAVIIVASRIVATAASSRVSKELAPVVAKTVADLPVGRGAVPPATKVVSALQLEADFDDWWCGTPPRWPWPWPGPWREEPHPDPWRESGLLDAVVLKAVNGLANLVPEIGSSLADTSMRLLKELAG
jgi:hypothetical protein